MGQVGPRWAKIASKLFHQSSKILQDGQRCYIWEVSWKFLVPRCARDEPKWLRLSQDSPKLIQKTPITAPRRGRLGRDNPRLLPSCSNKIPKSLKMATYELRWSQDGLGMAQDSARCLFFAPSEEQVQISKGYKD